MVESGPNVRNGDNEFEDTLREAAMRAHTLRFPMLLFYASSSHDYIEHCKAFLTSDVTDGVTQYIRSCK